MSHHIKKIAKQVCEKSKVILIAKWERASTSECQENKLVFVSRSCTDSLCTPQINRWVLHRNILCLGIIRFTNRVLIWCVSSWQLTFWIGPIKNIQIFYSFFKRKFTIHPSSAHRQFTMIQPQHNFVTNKCSLTQLTQKYKMAALFRKKA
jgi:hypothetical protein